MDDLRWTDQELRHAADSSLEQAARLVENWNDNLEANLLPNARRIPLAFTIAQAIRELKGE